ncbi:MAG: hypothetical protein ACLRHD_06455, partial [Thomasclavelia spiroformis]
NNENYSTNNLSINKLLAVSDESGFFHQIDGQLGCSIHFIENQEPLDTSIINQLNNLDHVKKAMIIIHSIIQCRQVTVFLKI